MNTSELTFTLVIIECFFSITMKAAIVKMIKDVNSQSLKWLEVSVQLVFSWHSYLVMVSKCIKQRIIICAPIGSR